MELATAKPPHASLYFYCNLGDPKKNIIKQIKADIRKACEICECLQRAKNRHPDHQEGRPLNSAAWSFYQVPLRAMWSFEVRTAIRSGGGKK